ncbi:MAG: molybdenum cofactor biosynthesis protein MoaE [Planctomycetes bacterium]|jgi:molybdopterin synthase catalytic subunit|nr:molybdenum cofactor biosynthesis protein MoaE [Planctomycetota bacterium]MCL4730297.1 molybdenum cofactor biosynthesis protein MoaE [Planctomycetota bacterium]
MITARLTTEKLDPNALLAEISHERDGAQVLFLGVVRNHHQGRAVARIDYEAYEPMARKELQKIADEVASQHGLERVLVVHRFGRHEIGDASIAVVIGSPHRAAAFEAARQIMDRVKTDVPIWKKEYFADGTIEWVLADRLVRSEQA